MGQHLALTIHLHDDRYHGVAEWPPAPARVFQALVAGVAQGATLPVDATRALEWLEGLSPPTIACPKARRGQSVGLFVPNNDADSLDGQLERLPDIRTKKTVTPRLFERSGPFLYLWTLEGASAHVDGIVEAAEQLFQLGRGVDPAWAVAQVCDDDAAAGLLRDHHGVVHHPASGPGTTALACPMVGSLASLSSRYQATLTRLRVEGTGKSAKTLFAQPPKPRFVEVAYDAPATRYLYELKGSGVDAVPSPLWRVVSLVESVRDAAAERLRQGLPQQAQQVEHSLIGRKADGSNGPRTAERIRILPLPSIGHAHADQAVRRIAVVVPAGSPLDAKDVHWAFSGLELQTSEAANSRVALTPTDDASMFERFAGAARKWHTITPAALPMTAARRRIDPARRREEAKDSSERIAEERAAIGAVHNALRHADVQQRPTHVAVQREPFDVKGTRAERFVTPRFPKERLWHVQLEFQEPVVGPLTLGDGRFLGLGLLAPSTNHEEGLDGIIGLEVAAGLIAHMNPLAAAHALRRAVMARTQAEWGPRPLPTFFTGHQADNKPAREPQSSHVAFQAAGTHLWVIAPHRLERRSATKEERAYWKTLKQAVQGLSTLRAGSLGVLELQRADDSASEDLLRSATTWRSLTPYTVQRHEHANHAHEAIRVDVVKECARRGLPTPQVQIHRTRAPKGHGLQADIELQFGAAVEGPIVLGRTRYGGGGLFRRVGESASSSTDPSMSGDSR